MSARPFELVVYLGRFQPFHNGHLATLQQAFEYGNIVLVGLGSAGEAPSVKNPFTESERMDMIQGSLSPQQNTRLYIVPLYDDVGDDAQWAAQVRRKAQHRVGKHAQIALTGVKKDASSFYLDMFPEWDFIPGPAVPLLNATDVRAEYFGGSPREVWAANVPPHVADFLDDYQKYERYHFIRQVVTGE